LPRYWAEPQKTPLPQPRARLEAQAVTVIPPGQQQASLRAVSFDIKLGSTVGVIGPSGAGKSTLARAIRYLPQRVQLFDGTIADNIARLDPNAAPEKNRCCREKGSRT